MNPALFFVLIIPVIAGISLNWTKYKDKKMTKKTFVTNTCVCTALVIIAGVLLMHK